MLTSTKIGMNRPVLHLQNRTPVPGNQSAAGAFGPGFVPPAGGGQPPHQPGFSLKNLYETKNPARLMLNTKDPEITGKKDGFSWRGDDLQLPSPLTQFPEGKMIWEFIHAPSTDLPQILSRRDFLKILSSSELLKELNGAKNAAYNIKIGIDRLFSPFPISDHHSEPALTAYLRHGVGGEVVFQALSEIEEGKKGLERLITLLTEVDGVKFREIIDLLRGHQQAIMHFGKDYFLNKKNKHSQAVGLSDALYADLSKLGMFISFALLAQTDNYAAASFAPGKPIEYKKGWLFARERSLQTHNDSAADRLITILCGSNMSGKSYNLKQNLFMQLLAQSFGFAPCTEGNFAVYDSIFYLDRASTDPYYNLSAFGKEVKNWIELFKALKGRPLLLVDEGFSTTSPEDQYRLLTGTALYMKGLGAKVYLASHSERFIEKLQNDLNAGIYHFKTRVGEKGDIAYEYQLTDGPDDSKALDVAAGLGLPRSVIELARQFLAGAREKAAAVKPPDKEDPKHHTEEERAVLKTSELSAGQLIVTREANRCFWPFSEDPNFKLKWLSGSDLYIGERQLEDSVRYAGRGYNRYQELAGRLLALLTHAGKLSSEEIHERRKMFAELAQNDRYQEISQMAGKIIRQNTFLSMLSRDVVGSLLEFNLALRPFRDRDQALRRLDLLIAYLGMNKKILGPDFNMDLDLRRMEKYDQLLKILEERQKNQNVEEIEAVAKKEADELVPEEAAAYFIEAAFDEPEPEKWGGRVTRLRVAQYLKWLDTHYSDGWSQLHKIFYKENWHKKKGIKRLKLITPELEAAFREITKDESGPVTRERVEAYLNEVFSMACRRKDRIEKRLKPVIRGYSGIWFDAADDRRDLQRYIGMSDSRIKELFVELEPEFEGKRITPDIIQACASEAAQKAVERSENLPAIPIFLCDLGQIAEELKLVIAYIKEDHEDGDYGSYYNDWPPKLVSALIIEMLFEPKPLFGEMLSFLRSYDSVNLHQAANHLDRARKEFMGFGEVTELFSALADKFDHGTKKMFFEYQVLERKIKALMDKYARSRSSYRIEYAMNIFLWAKDGRLPPDLGAFFNNYRWYLHIEWNEASLRQERRIREAKEPAERQRLFHEFYQENIVQTGILTEIEDIYRTMCELGDQAKELNQKYALKIEKESLASVAKGHLSPLFRAIAKKYYHSVNEITRLDHEGGRYLTGEVFWIQTLALFGHMVKTMGFVPVTLNKSGEVKFEGLWNMVEPRERQISNPASFGIDERLKLIASPNMSGKTYYLKALTFAVLCGRATGHAPANAATLPLLDAVVFLDRVTSNNDRNLSAFGNEISFWKAFLRLLDDNKAVFACVDEAFSTTSPAYQSALTYAIAATMLQHGQLMALASHNHDVIDVLAGDNPETVAAYHFATHFDEQNEIQFDYRMRPGHGLSQALDVARKLGLPEGIIEIAQGLKDS